jgi:hypothetical protein
MNSYINFILETDGAKERLGRLFRSAPEPETNEQSLPLSMVRKQRQRQKHSVWNKWNILQIFTFLAQ